MDVARQHHKAHTTNTEGTHLAEPHAKAPGRTEWPPNTGSFGVGGSRKEATGLEVGDGDNMYCPQSFGTVFARCSRLACAQACVAGRRARTRILVTDGEGRR